MSCKKKKKIKQGTILAVHYLQIKEKYLKTLYENSIKKSQCVIYIM